MKKNRTKEDLEVQEKRLKDRLEINELFEGKSLGEIRKMVNTINITSAKARTT